MSRAPNPKIFKPMSSKKMLQFFLLGLLWLLFCIPVVTIGAATCSVFYVALKILNDDADVNVWKSFIKGIKENFVQGLLMLFVSIITVGGTGAFIWWIIEKSSQSIPIVCVAIGVCFIVLVLNIFAYPIIGRYENTFANKIRNAIALAFTYSRETLRCTGFVAAELAIAGVLFRLNMYAGFASLLFWPSLIFYTTACFMASIFYRVENPVQYDAETDDTENQDAETDDTENQENQNEEIES
jgi:uncharacterized membrane protein YesL